MITTPENTTEREVKASRPISCQFCGKPESELLALIAGPNTFICNECVVLCIDIMKDQMNSQTTKDYINAALQARATQPPQASVGEIQDTYKTPTALNLSEDAKKLVDSFLTIKVLAENNLRKYGRGRTMQYILDEANEALALVNAGVVK